ncbi:MAG: DUF2752 domain-containing protein [Deltaproteobacteria bacterium]|nr:DUF2752 domain-containing protein [Deltaproteobacteria bacterium]
MTGEPCAPTPHGGGPPAAGTPRGHPDPLSVSELVLLAGFLALLGASVILGPGEDSVRILGVRIPSFCLFYNLTGLHCPGCGLTRSFVFMGHGQVLDAFRIHPLGPILYLVVLEQAGVRSWQSIRALRARRLRDGATPPGAPAPPS